MEAHTEQSEWYDRAHLKEPQTPASVPHCPTCRRPLPRPKTDEEMEGKKLRRSWTINVPKDHLEDGAEVLDSLLEGCREIFGHDSHRNVKYHTMVQALALVVQNGHKMMADA